MHLIDQDDSKIVSIKTKYTLQEMIANAAERFNSDLFSGYDFSDVYNVMIVVVNKDGHCATTQDLLPYDLYGLIGLLEMLKLDIMHGG